MFPTARRALFKKAGMPLNQHGWVSSESQRIIPIFTLWGGLLGAFFIWPIFAKKLVNKPN